MQQISNLPVFTGTIPNKATQNDTDFANNIFGFLNYSGNIFVADFNSTIGEFNTLSDEIELVAETIGANLKTVTDKVDEVVVAAAAAEAAIAVLENGTINDLIIGENKAYSNQKINNLFETNTYTHPSSHDASMINESTTKRFVSDTEKDSWNAKLDASSRTPAGTIITFASATAPTGYLKANGALLSRTTYSALFAAIGTTFGVGDGSTTFALPDLRGYFPRGWDDGRGIDTSRVFGSSQNDGYLNHAHTASSSSSSHSHLGYGANGSGPLEGIQRAYLNYANTTSLENSGAHTHTITVNASTTGATETRPKNIALLYCIKY